ncbi:MAG: response regulator, partial [Gemmiger sp.]|nr:response regulator [Gemmiger sp.]
MNILILDDEHYILDGLRILLQRHFGEHSLYFCSAARQASKLIETVAPDIVVSDINMNEMNGLDFITLLREQYPEVRVIVISGYSDFGYAQRAIQLQVASYVLKPIDQAQFVALL